MTEILGKKYSFRELIEKNNFKISIPLIQRDYVQGKSNKAEVRNEFLKTLKSYLEEGINKDLDFVYGYVENNDFIPLDGQQRLTTLFLLHTYLAQISGNYEVWQNLLTKGNQLNFNYKVRRSSSEFCKDLIQYGIDFESVENIKLEMEKNGKIFDFQKYISNLHWYKLSWNLDPTIVSMINMLYSIHLLFKNNASFYEKLMSEDNPVLTFLFLDLKDLNQGDELYIKMNARGKMLTSYENFKARLEEKIGFLFKENDIVRKLNYNNKVIELNTKDYFSFNIDTIWSNLFWPYRTLVGNPNNFDDEIFNFIKEIFLIHFIRNTEDSELLEKILKSNLDTFNQINDFKLINKESIAFLIQVLDAIKFDNKGISKFCNNIYFEEEEIFKSVLSGKIQNPDRVKFYAYLLYITNKNFEFNKLQDWMRVITNFVENKILNSVGMIIPAFKSVANLAVKANEINEYLTTNPTISFFESNQILEEKIKANIFKIIPDSYKKIFKIEQSIFHKGQIAYLFEVSDLISNINILNAEIICHERLERQLDIFYDYSFKSISLFEYLNFNTDFTFERGILSYGFYLIKKSEGQYNFCSSRKVANYERDYSWKRLLEINFSKINDEEWKPKREVIYKILNDNDFDFNNVEKSLKYSIKSFNDKTDWRYDFIKEPLYIEHCGQGFIYTYKNTFENIQLLNASQMNHLRMDYYVFKFWIENRIQKINKYYHFIEHVKGTYDVPYIMTSAININRKTYAIQFYNMEGKTFYLRFFKTKGYNREEDFGVEIKEYLLGHKFKWNEDVYHKGYTYSSTDYKKVTNLYLEFLRNLNL